MRHARTLLAALLPGLALPAAAQTPPNISQALDCGAAEPGGAGTSRDLQRKPIDLAVFPDALCNDGSNAVFYFRPYSGEENRDRWLINLNGGGSCSSGPSCAARWCWCRSLDGPNGCPFAGETTNFSMANMNGDERAGTPGDGIFLRGDASRPNPMGNWNQVRVVYCSSDTWMGTRRDSVYQAVHPKTGAPVSYSIHFLGQRILLAALATLKRDGVPALSYTFSSPARTLPDLDEAVEVVLSGDSAGGIGVQANLDRVAELLRASNTRGSLVVRGLMDASTGPDRSRLDYTTTVHAPVGLDSYDKSNRYQWFVADASQGAVYDQSCLSYHASREPGSEVACADITHVIRNHVTTPFFVRMALLDSNLSGHYIEEGYSDPQLGRYDLTVFGTVLQRELSAFPDLRASAEEGALMSTAPGVFAPACTKHDTIHLNAEVYGTAITPPGGRALRLFDVFEPWRSGTQPALAITQTPTRSDTACGSN